MQHDCVVVFIFLLTLLLAFGFDETGAGKMTAFGLTAKLGLV